MRLSFIPAILFLATPALAQDDTTPQAPPTNTTVLMPPNPPPAAQTQEDDPAPLRLSAIIAEAAAVERRGRIAEGVLGIFAGGGGIATGAALIVISDNQTNKDAMLYMGGIAIGFGGLTVLTSVWDLFVHKGLERLDDAYAPIAHDTRIPAAKRLSEGEQALEGFAQAGKSSRIYSGVTSIVIGAALGIATAPIVSTVPDTNANGMVRAYLGIGLGLSAFLMLASGITTIVVKRTEAEQLWNMWLAGTGRTTSRLQPFITPSGIGATF